MIFIRIKESGKKCGGPSRNSVFKIGGDVGEPPEIADMEIYFEENIYMRSNIKDGEKHLIDVGSNVECEAIPPGLSLTVTSLQPLESKEKILIQVYLKKFSLNNNHFEFFHFHS